MIVLARLHLILVLGLAALLMVGIGCLGGEQKSPAKNDTNASAANTSAPVPPAAVCGNGQLEAGETTATCCLDAGCGAGQGCYRQDDGSYICAKLQKNETAAVGKIREIYQQSRIQLEDWSLLNASNAASGQAVQDSLDQMQPFITELENMGYDASAERFLYEAAGTAYSDRIEVESRRNSALKRVEAGRSRGRDPYLNALDVSLEELDNAIYTAGNGETRLLNTYARYSGKARGEAWMLYSMDEGMPQWMGAFKDELTAVKGQLKAEQTRMSPHIQNEWVDADGFRLKLRNAHTISCPTGDTRGSENFLVFGVQVENNRDSDVVFGPDNFRVRDRDKNQYSPGEPALNATTGECHDYYSNKSGLASQSLLPSSIASGDVWIDLRDASTGMQWEITADVPGSEALVFRASTS